MRSDPGLLYYMVERVIEGGGWPPSDFRSDPRVEWPATTDLPALDSVSQEFPIAWAHLLFGGGIPLHIFCLRFMAVWASLSAVGVYLLSLELTGKTRWAILAVATYALMPANFRTIGFVLMREDFALPFFALHLALLARAARLRTAGAMVLCGLPLAAAVASWHAMGFFVALELFCIFLWYLRTDENPLDLPSAAIVPAVVAASSLVVPILWRTGFLLSVPMRLTAGLLVASLLKRRGVGRVGRAGAALGTVGLLGLPGILLSTERGGDYGHVWELMLAKVRFIGELPRDPGLLSFDARMMWQGPFSTFPPEQWVFFFGVALILGLPAVAASSTEWFRRSGRTEACLVATFAVVGLAFSWLVERVMPLPGLLLPVCVVLFLSRFERRHVGIALMAAALVIQAGAFQWLVSGWRISWYQPAFLTQEYRELIDILPSLVPEGEAVMADPVISTAVLAHTRRPIVLQPKWEEAEARRRFRDFLTEFFHGTPESLKRLMRERYRCRYLLVDRWTLWTETRYIAGLGRDRTSPDLGTPAAVFLGGDAAPRTSVPGYRLLYRSPSSFPARFGSPQDEIQLYELTGGPVR